MPFCTQCGSRNPDDANFCANCGSRLVKVEPGTPPAQPDQSATEAGDEVGLHAVPSGDAATETGAEPAADSGEPDESPADAEVQSGYAAIADDTGDAGDSADDSPEGSTDAGDASGDWVGDDSAAGSAEPTAEPGEGGDVAEDASGQADGPEATDATGTTPPVEEAPPADSTITFGVPSGAVEEAGSAERSSLDDDDAAAVDALPQGSALLVVQRGPGAGNRFLLDQDVVTAGRHPESEIFLDDITVSRRHVEFRRTPEGYRVADVGSLNGTYVNRDRIDEAALQNGDEVQIGKFRLVYFTGDVPAGH